MKIKTKSTFVVTLVLLLLGILLATLFSLSNVRGKLADAEYHRYRAARVADQLRQSSDDLTRMARTYAVTGNPIYEKYFHHILDIRNGKVSRPIGYDGVYWDKVTATGELPTTDADPVSLKSLLENLNLTPTERFKLDEAERESNDLVELEVMAFNALKGVFKDRGGAYSIRGEPNLEMARNLTHGDAYHAAKHKIMQPIGDFMIALNERTRKQTNRLAQSEQYHIAALVLLSAIIFLVVAYSSFNLLQKVIAPIEDLSRVSEQIGRGELQRRATKNHSDDEIGTLYIAFNQMVDETQRSIRLLEEKTEEAVSLEKQARDASQEIIENNILLENRVSERTAELQISENKLKAIINNATAIIYMKDEQGRYTLVNDRFCQLFCMNDKDVVGLDDYDIFPAEFAEDYRKNDLDVFVHGVPVEREENALIDNKEYTFISVKFPMKDVNNKTVAVCGISTDITHLKQIEIDRLKLETQLRHVQKMDAVGQLTGGIAHDFNNILNIIYGNLELLESRISNDNIAMERLEKAMKGTLRGADITRKLLNFSRKDAYEVRLVSVNKFIQNIEDLIAKSLTAKIKVEIQLAENLWPVSLDPGDLEDALLNLAINSRDAMPDGGTLVIETANKYLDERYVERNPESKSGDFVMISVSDTGTGFTEENKEKAFEPFFTTKGPGKGTGLGLSMVYGFVQRSGGHLKIYSEAGVGSTIRFYLPRVHVREHVSDINRKNDYKMPVGSETVLVVDDEEGLLDVAVSYLQDLGYKTFSASNGADALKIIRENRDLDLLFSDIIMLGSMDGYQLARAAHGENPALKILLASGFTKKREEYLNGESRYLSKLAANLLTKPYNQAELAIAVRQICNNATA